MTYTSFEITTAPSSMPVGSADMKSHLRIAHTDEDTLLATLQMATQELLGRITRRSLMVQTITLKLDDFPSGTNAIELPRPPTISVTSIQYVDVDGATQTWASANYDVDTSSSPAMITPAYNGGTLQEYPDVRTDTPNSVTVVYQAGHTTLDDIPESMRLAHMMLVAHFYENREVSSSMVMAVTELPFGLQMLVGANQMSEVY